MYRLFFVFLVFSVFNEAMAVPNCSKEHCGTLDADANEVCKANKMEGKPFLVYNTDGSKCLCTCSCMSVDTMVRQNAKSSLEVQDLRSGDPISSPYSEFSENLIDKILYSNYELLDEPGTVRQLHFSNGSKIVVSPDHTFVTPNEKIVSAEELQVGHSILAEDYGSVQVVSNETDSQFRGKLMNLIVNLDSPEAKHHFLVTNSVISGDWLVQSNYSSFRADIDIRLGKIKELRL